MELPIFHPHKSIKGKIAYNIPIMALEHGKTHRPRVIWLNVNGLTASLFYEMLDSGKLPNFSKIFSDGIRVDNAYGIFPPRTVPSMASMLTGSFPTTHGLPDNTLFDRYGKHPKFRSYHEILSFAKIRNLSLFSAHSAILPPARGNTLANADLSGASRTIFEELSQKKIRSAAAFSPISRGARDVISPSSLNILKFIFGAKLQSDFHHLDFSLFNQIHHYVLDCRKLPRLIFMNAPGFEAFIGSPKSPNPNDFLANSLDPLFGRILDIISQRYPINDYTFVLSSAYGLIQLQNKSMKQIPIRRIMDVLTQNGYNPVYPFSNDYLKKKDIILCGNGNSFNLYVKNGQSLNWYDPPHFRDDLLKISMLLMNQSSDSSNSPFSDFIDFTLIKDYVSKCYIVHKGDKLYELSKFLSRSDINLSHGRELSYINDNCSTKSADIICIIKSDYCVISNVEKQSSDARVISSYRHESLPLLASGPHLSNLNIQHVSIIDIKEFILYLFYHNSQLMNNSPLLKGII